MYILFEAYCNTIKVHCISDNIENIKKVISSFDKDYDGGYFMVDKFEPDIKIDLHLTDYYSEKHLYEGYLHKIKIE